jgi:hypothetical protein
MLDALDTETDSSIFRASLMLLLRLCFERLEVKTIIQHKSKTTHVSRSILANDVEIVESHKNNMFGTSCIILPIVCHCLH